ncbi:MAG: FeoB-associated Cys-rich membrane protein [Acetanaerobacterium sp.]
MATYIIGGIVIGALVLAAWYSIKKTKEGKCVGCSGCCGSCPGHSDDTKSN